MRNTTVRAAAFLLGLALLLSLFSQIFRPKDNRDESGMEEYTANGFLGERDNSLDVLVLGDSETYSGISPMELWRETGYTSYVCGSSRQRLCYSVTLLRRALARQSPKIVILETNAIFREVEWEERVCNLLGWGVPLLEYHDRWKSLHWSDLTRPVRYTWKSACKGFRPDKEVQACSGKGYMTASSQAEQIPSGNVAYVERIRKLCQQKGAQLILLSTPSTVNWNSKRHNAIRQLAQELGVAYLDMNEEGSRPGIDWNTDSRDSGDHLNYSGACKVTRALGEYLSGLGVLTDHRTDRAYADWNALWQEYEKKVEEA